MQKGKNAPIIICGWSCKDLSTCSKNFKFRTKVLQSGCGSSGSTFHGLLDVLEGLPDLRVFIGENVKEMTKISSDNRTFMYESLAKHGWVSDIQLLEASEYGACVRRPRAWAIAYNAKRLGIEVPVAHRMVADTFQLVNRLKVVSEISQTQTKHLI